MRKKIYITSILIISMLLTSCSALDSLSKQVNGAIQPTVQATQPIAQATQGAASGSSQTGSTVVPSNISQQATTSAPVQPVVVANGALAAYEEALTQIYDGVNPSVVSILSITAQGGAQGSGFVWDTSGHIVTNNHVVDGATSLSVEFYDGTIVQAQVVGTDVYSDLAVLKVDVAANFLAPVQLADSDLVKVGGLAIAIGNPFALANTMTVGIVSAIGRSIPAGNANPFGQGYSIPNVIQTDAAVNPGNSGGVLVNDAGQVIGVTAAIESPTQANAGIGFAIPSNIVKLVVPGLIANGKYDHPYLGITGTGLYPDLAKALGLAPEQRGAVVIQVTPGGPAEQAGIKGSTGEVTVNGQQIPSGGDVITAIDNLQVRNMDELIAYLFSKTQVGQTVKLTVLRGSKESTVDIVLQARPAQDATTQSAQSQSSAGAFMGITGVDMTKALAGAMNLPTDQTGVLIESVQPGSPAEAAGLVAGQTQMMVDGQPVLTGGDIITGIAGHKVNTLDELAQFLAAAQPGNQLNLTILRDGKTQEAPITLGQMP